MLRLISSLLVVWSCAWILAEDGYCAGGRECSVQEECSAFMEERTRLRSFSRNSSEYQAILRKLKRLVCNKNLKKVCCDRELAITTTKSRRRLEEDPSWLPSLKMQECGLSASAESPGFVLGGNETKLGQFPWTVLVGKTSARTGQFIWHCGGTLINAWYVLTAAHCGEVERVRLGEWRVVDTSKPDLKTCAMYSEEQRGSCEGFCDSCHLESGDVDCDWRNNCAEKHQDVEVVEVKVHPSYRQLRSKIPINDIMLVKLKYPANFNNFVAPICMPDKQEARRIRYFGEQGAERVLSYGKPIVVGWGQTYTAADGDISIVSSARQQQVALPVVSNQQCADKYSQLFKRDVSADIRIGEHICAGGVRGKDSCRGDSGGPLLGRGADPSPYILVGVVSVGTRICGSGAPGIITRVTHYRNWILKNLK